jgi:hypothetical protein
MRIGVKGAGKRWLWMDIESGETKAALGLNNLRICFYFALLSEEHDR